MKNTKPNSEADKREHSIISSRTSPVSTAEVLLLCCQYIEELRGIMFLSDFSNFNSEGVICAHSLSVQELTKLLCCLDLGFDLFLAGLGIRSRTLSMPKK